MNLKKMGRPMKPETITEELLAETTACGLEGILTDDPSKQRALFVRMVKAAVILQDVTKGLVTKNYEFNGHLLALLGEENLN